MTDRITPHHPAAPIRGTGWAGLACICARDGDRLVVRDVVSGHRAPAPGDDLLAMAGERGATRGQLAELAAASAGDAPTSVTVRLASEGPLRVACTPLPDGAVSVGWEALPDHQAEPALDEGDVTWLRAAFEDAEEMVWGGRIENGTLVPVFASAGFRAVLRPDGPLREQVQTWVAAVHPDDREAVLERFRQVADGTVAQVAEYRMIRSDGEVRWVRSSLARLGEGSDTTAFWGVVTDITAERTARQDLERVLSAVRDVLLEITWTPGGDWFIRFASPSAAAVLGLPGGEAASITAVLQRSIHADDRLALERAVRRLRAGANAERISLRITTQHMAVRRLEGTLVAGRDDTGAPRVLGVLSDLTERRALEARLRRIAEVIDNVVFEAEPGPDGGWSMPYVSPSAARLLGVPLPPGPVAAAETFLDGVHVDDVAAIRAGAELALRDHMPVNVRCRLVRADGDVRRLRVTLTRFESEDGSPRVAGVTTDVTDQWDAEQRAHRVIEAVDAIIVEGRLLPDGRWEMSHASTPVERLIGRQLPSDPVQRGGVLFRAIHPDDRPAAVRAIRDVVERGAPVSIEMRVVRANGEVRWIRKLVAPAALPDDPTRFASVVTDITDVRSAGDRLRRVLDSLEEVIIEGEVGKDDRWHATFASAAVDRLLGRALPDDPAARAAALHDAIHPDDRDGFERLLRALARQGGSRRVTVRVQRADGTVRLLRGTMARRDAPPAEPAAAGVLTDVTELLHTGQQLRRVERGLSLQVAATEPVLYEAHEDPTGTWVMTHLSSAAEALLGVPIPDDPLERMTLWTSRVPAAELRAMAEVGEMVMASGQPRIALYPLATENGERWVQSTISRLGARRVGGVMIDVSGVLDADDALRSAQAGLADVIEGLGEAVYEMRVRRDGGARIEFATPRLWSMIGVDPLTGIDRALPLDGVHPDDRELVETRIMRTLEGVPLALDVRGIAPDGHTCWLRITGRPRMQDDGSVLLAGTVADITEDRALLRVDAARPSHDHHAGDDDGPRLTSRQQDVLVLLARGAPTEEIAETLAITRTTVANHVAAILRRLGARSRLEAVHMARTSGLLGPE